MTTRDQIFGVDHGQFATMLYGVLDTHEHVFRFVCAGHPSPILATLHESSIVHPPVNFPIGLVDDATYEEKVLRLPCGTRLLIYSDGVVEQMNLSDKQFGEQRLIDTIDETRQSSLQESLSVLDQRVLDWSGDDRLNDDLSVLAFEREAIE